MKSFNLLSRIITIDNFSRFLLSILIIAFVIRILMNIFKAAAIRQGEADCEEIKFSSWGCWEAFWKSFCSRGRHRNIDDYFLPSIIGGIELFMYPFLMLLDQWTFIAVLIGLKTAVHWGKWHEVRTAYNRFLLGNLLVIVLSLFIMTAFLKVEENIKIEKTEPIKFNKESHP